MNTVGPVTFFGSQNASRCEISKNVKMSSCSLVSFLHSYLSSQEDHSMKNMNILSKHEFKLESAVKLRKPKVGMGAALWDLV